MVDQTENTAACFSLQLFRHNKYLLVELVITYKKKNEPQPTAAPQTLADKP